MGARLAGHAIASALRAQMPNLLAALASNVDDGAPEATIDSARAAALPRRRRLRLPASRTRGCGRTGQRSAAARAWPQCARTLAVQRRSGRGGVARRGTRLCSALGSTPRNARAPCTRWPGCAGAAGAAPPTWNRCSTKRRRWPAAATIWSCAQACPRCELWSRTRTAAITPKASACTPRRSRSGNRSGTGTRSERRYNLAVCAQNTNRNAEALQRIEPIIASARALNDWRRLNQSLNVRGNAHSGLRDWPRAFADYQECIRIAWENMASFDLAFGLWNLPARCFTCASPSRRCAWRRTPRLLARTLGELSAADQRCCSACGASRRANSMPAHRHAVARGRADGARRCRELRARTARGSGSAAVVRAAPGADSPARPRVIGAFRVSATLPRIAQGLP